MSIKKVSAILLTVIAMSLVCIVVMFGGLKIAHAESPVSGADGRYNVSYEIGGQSGIGAEMIAKYFDKTVVVEKIGNNYYASVTQLSSSMENLSLNLADGMQVGYRITEDNGNRKTFSYTLSEENLSKALPFSVFVAPRGETFDFTITLDLANATRTGDVEDTTTDRPGEYVPVITTTAGDTQMEKGATYVLPQATAALGDEVCEVTTKVYYDGEEVAFEGNRLALENAGEYTVIYRAECPTYKTNLGNNSYSEYSFIVTSKVGATTLAKFEDESGVFSSGTAIQASNITVGTAYELAAEKMKTIADTFSVMSVSYFAESGEEVTPSGNVTLYLAADMTFDRNEIVVYHLSDDGELTKIDCSGYGRYVRLQTDKTGTFIICIPGVAFVMPMWCWALIAVGGIVIIAAAVTLVVLTVKRKKRLKNKTDIVENK